MRLPLLFLFVSVPLLAQCFASRPSLESQWNVLDQAISLDCEPWPRPERMLEVSRMVAISSEANEGTAYVVAEGLDRKGTPVVYLGKVDDAEVDADDIDPLPLGGSPLAGGYVAGRPVLLAAREDALELRDLNRNVVLGTSKIEVGPDRKVFSSVGKDAMTIASMNNEDRWQMVRFKFAKGKVSSAPSRNIGTVADSLIVSHGDDSWTVIERQQNSFRLNRSVGKKQVSDAVQPKLSGNIESWSASALGDRLIFAVVAGDSIVGEASLAIFAVDLSISSINPRGRVVAKIAWTKQFTMNDVHLSTPVFTKSAQGLLLLMLNWVDAESTIASYPILAEGVESTFLQGVFPKGTRIENAFLDRGKRALVVRRKLDLGWQFSICELEDES